jgi:hypothetical protein
MPLIKQHRHKALMQHVFQERDERLITANLESPSIVQYVYQQGYSFSTCSDAEYYNMSYLNIPPAQYQWEK